MSEQITEAIWQGFKNSPFVDLSLRDAEAIARTVLESPAMRDLLAEAWDEGYRARIDFMALRNEVRAEDNPYRSGADR